MKYNGYFFSGYSFDSGDFIKEGNVRVIKISNIQNNGISWEDLSFSFFKTLYNEYILSFSLSLSLAISLILLFISLYILTQSLFTSLHP